MAKDETKRISPQTLRDDEDALAALRAIEKYAPSDANYTVPKLDALATAMGAAQDGEAQAEATLKTARDNANAVEWEFHNAMLRAKELVIGQFGKDSDEVQAVGLKKKSEYRTPSRSSKTESAPAVSSV